MIFHLIQNTIIESLPTFPIPVEERKDALLGRDRYIYPLDDSIPPGIESNDYVSEVDDNLLPLLEFESTCHDNYPDTEIPPIDVVDVYISRPQQTQNQTQVSSTTDRSIRNLFDTTMTTLADKSLLSGGDNKPPMLEKHLYDSWKSRMELYMLNRPHGRMILASVEKGPLVWPSITVDGVTRLKEYIELTSAEAIQADCDIKEINIILEGLLTEIYSLVSQHRVAKDLWEKIKVLMQGTSLTKQKREQSYMKNPISHLQESESRYKRTT
ncbi:hypothetical protein Tco_0365186 [Tanacetum coccineum]